MASSHPGPSSSSRWWTLICVSLGTLMLTFDLSVVSIALPFIRDPLSASFEDLQWVLDAYALTLAVLLVPAGSLADRYGRKKLFLIGFAVFTASSLACAVAQSALFLNVSRGVQGIGAAVLFAVGPAMLGHEFRGKERALAFSVFGASFGGGVALGPLLGGALCAVDWRWIFFINIPIGVAAIAVTAWRSPESRSPHVRPLDRAGFALLTVGLAGLVLAIIRGGVDGWTSPRIITLFVISIAAIVLLVLVEIRQGDAALFEPELFKNRTFVGFSAVTLIASVTGIPAIFIETNYVSNLLGSDAWSTGLRFLPLTGSMFIFGAVGGALIGKVPYRVIFGVSSITLAIGLLLTRMAGVDDTWTALIPSMFVAGLSMGVFSTARSALAIGVAPPAKAGVASGINETFLQVGFALGVAGIGALFKDRIHAALSDSAVASALGPEQTEQLARAVSAGVLPTADGPGGPAVSEAARSAFVTGFHGAMTMCAIFSLVAAVIAFLTIRTDDLHPSAFSTIPPDLDEAAEEVAAQAN